MVRPSLGSDGPAGKSRIVPVKMSESEKADALAECDEGEALSALIREATRREVIRRRQKKALAKIAAKKRTSKKK